MKRVLLINDSKFESIILKDMLSEMGYDVRIGDEFSAVQLVRQYDPHVLIANLVMRQTRGDQLISIVKMANPNIICLISSSSPISMKEFRFRKIDGVFQTPTSQSALAKLLNEISQSTASACG